MRSRSRRPIIGTALMTVWGCRREKMFTSRSRPPTRSSRAAGWWKRPGSIAGSSRWGTTGRSDGKTIAAMRLLHEGKLGSVYRAKRSSRNPGGDIGTVQESSILRACIGSVPGAGAVRSIQPQSLSLRLAFLLGHFDDGRGQHGVHSVDAARWGLNKRVHPVKVHSAGGVFAWENDQQTPTSERSVRVCRRDAPGGGTLEPVHSRRREDMTFYTTGVT